LPSFLFPGPPGASFVSDSIRLFRVRFPVEAGFAFQFFAFAFPFPAIPTLSDHFRVVSDSDLNSMAVGGPFPFGWIRLYQVFLSV
ncbi:hypothetical protein ACWGCI_37335, partial [Streptomyces sp. NPDC054949]